MIFCHFTLVLNFVKRKNCEIVKILIDLREFVPYLTTWFKI